jgi:hypothetical protein
MESYNKELSFITREVVNTFGEYVVARLAQTDFRSGRMMERDVNSALWR